MGLYELNDVAIYGVKVTLIEDIIEDVITENMYRIRGIPLI